MPNATQRIRTVPNSFLALLILFTAASAVPAAAQRMEPEPDELEGVGVEEKLDQPVPLDLTFQNERDQTVRLGQYFDGGKPVILTLVYFECPMLCNVILDALVDTLKDMSMTPGEDFEIVTVSFNPLETPTIAQAWKQNYMKKYEKPAAASGWHFLTGRKEQIQKLTEAVGFQYKWVESRREYAHPAVLNVLTPDGRVSRYLYGVYYDPKTVRLSLVEASEGKIGNTLDRFILTCYYYDADSGKYAPMAMNIMRLGGLITVLTLGAVLGSYWLLESRRKHTTVKGART